MRKLRYNIYKNISDEQYIIIQDKLIIIEAKIAYMLMKTNWHIIPPALRHEGLFIDFTLNNPDFNGNFGIKFQDQAHCITFTFYLTKSFDEGNNRFSLSHTMFENKEFGFFEDHLSEVVNSALEKYNNWSKEDVIISGDKIELQN